jgi:8-oxo-dGTP pyrophosphatase MutT (NUDIX family)
VTGPRIVPLTGLDLVHDGRSWPFAVEQRARIDAHFAALQRRNPALWNGRVLLLHRYDIAQGTLTGACLDTDYASFLAWRDWGFPDAGVHNVFAMGALRSADGAFLLAEMGAQTANAGQVYFPCGTPDPADITAGRVDLEGSVRREVAEETGLQPADYREEGGWQAVLDGPYIAVIRRLDVPAYAAELCARIRRYLGQQEEPELADMRVVRGPADLDPRMPPFVLAYLRRHWT